MAGKGGAYRFFILVIAALAAAGCSSPMGSIGQGAPGASVYDGLLVEFTRAYKVGDFFKRDDLRVYTIAYNSDEKRQVTPDGVRIEDPDKPGQFISVPAPGGRELTAIGFINILVEYKGLSVKYTIEVVDSDGDITMPSGIQVEWAHLKP